jgi:hypothetical protein
MQKKLLGIINVDSNATGQLLIIYSAFVKYWREKKKKKKKKKKWEKNEPLHKMFINLKNEYY